MEFAAESIVLPVLGLALMLAGLPVGWPLPGGWNLQNRHLLLLGSLILLTVSCVLLVSVLFLLTVSSESISFASGLAHFGDSLVRFASLCAVFADSLVRIAFRGLWERSPRTSKTVPGLPEA